MRCSGYYGGTHDAVGDEDERNDCKANLTQSRKRCWHWCSSRGKESRRTLYTVCMRPSRGPVVPSFHPPRKHAQHRTANWILALRREAGVEAGTAVAGASRD